MVSLTEPAYADPVVHPHRVALYVPSTIDIDKKLPPESAARAVNATMRLLSRLFGGATAMPANGAWLASNGELVIENVTIVYAFAAELSADAMNEIRYYASAMRRVLGQDAIALETNSGLEFIKAVPELVAA